MPPGSFGGVAAAAGSGDHSPGPRDAKPPLELVKSETRPPKRKKSRPAPSIKKQLAKKTKAQWAALVNKLRMGLANGVRFAALQLDLPWLRRVVCALRAKLDEALGEHGECVYQTLAKSERKFPDGDLAFSLEFFSDEASIARLEEALEASRLEYTARHLSQALHLHLRGTKGYRGALEDWQRLTAAVALKPNGARDQMVQLRAGRRWIFESKVEQLHAAMNFGGTPPSLRWVEEYARHLNLKISREGNVLSRKNLAKNGCRCSPKNVFVTKTKKLMKFCYLCKVQQRLSHLQSEYAAVLEYLKRFGYNIKVEAAEDSGSTDFSISSGNLKRDTQPADNVPSTSDPSPSTSACTLADLKKEDSHKAQQVEAVPHVWEEAKLENSAPSTEALALVKKEREPCSKAQKTEEQDHNPKSNVAKVPHPLSLREPVEKSFCTKASNAQVKKECFDPAFSEILYPAKDLSSEVVGQSQRTNIEVKVKQEPDSDD